MSENNANIVEIEGVHRHAYGSTHVFTLSDRDLIRLAALLETVNTQLNPAICTIGGFKISFEAGRRERGYAGYDASGELVLYSNMADLHTLAEFLRSVAEQVEDEGTFPHVHLNDTFLDGSDAVNDIVFEKVMLGT